MISLIARSIGGRPLFVGLNILGLALGTAVFLTLILVVMYESGFDSWISGAANVARVDTIWSEPGASPSEESATSFVVRDLLQADYPQITAATRIMALAEPVSADAVLASETVSYVDPDFFKVLPLPLLQGDAATALRPSMVVVSERIARKYFGPGNALGRTLTLVQNGAKYAFTVAAVMRDLPQNTNLDINILTVFNPAVTTGVNAFVRWGSSAGEIFVRVRAPEAIADINATLRDFVARRASGPGRNQEGTHPENHLALALVPLPSLHFHDVNVEADRPGADERVLKSFLLIGLLALLTAALNYVNLATANAGLRAREVALRRVLGGTRLRLIQQFLGEALALVAVSAVFGLALTELAVPFINAHGGFGIGIDYAQMTLLLLGIVIITGIGAGFYPAFLLSGFNPAEVLSASRMPSGGRAGARLRQALVVVQFTGAIAFAICTLVIDVQASYLRTADRGFDKDGLILIDSLATPELESRQTVITDAMSSVQGVASVTRSDREPAGGNAEFTDIHMPGGKVEIRQFLHETVGRNFFSTYGIHFLAGRGFDAARATDDTAGRNLAGATVGVVINRTAASRLGLSEPGEAIGQTLQTHANGGTVTLQIVGVVEDVRFTSPRDPVAPQFYTENSQPFDSAIAAVRVRGADTQETMRQLAAAWRQIVPDEPFVAKTAEEELQTYYRPDELRGGLFSAGALIAIAVACLGLYGLAAFVTLRRNREIGIRKTLGASTAEVLVLLTSQFMKPVVTAAVLACPIAFFAARSWLGGFDQRIALSIWYFVLAIGAALALAVCTVLGQAWHVARSRPSVALHYE